MKILWCVTGAGQFLSESVEAFSRLSGDTQVTPALSKAGREVCRMYGCLSILEKKYPKIILEDAEGASFPAVGRLTRGEYNAVIVAPCTANTCAKIVSGIADSLVSNIVAQAGKCKVPVYILPTDAVRKQKTRLPVAIDRKQCKKCSPCNAMKICPDKAIYMTDAVHVDLTKCNACQRCIPSCAAGAISFGKEISIECRDLDMKNAAKLSSIKGITALKSPSQITGICQNMQGVKRRTRNPA